MKNQHTPGPYSTSGIPGDNHVMARVPGRAGKVTVAIVPGWPGIAPEEHDANMALFQAAPELLAALDECLAWHELDDHRSRPVFAHQTEIGRAVLSRARAAFLAAKGGAK